MNAESLLQNVICSGDVSESDGLRDFFEELVSSDEVKRSLVHIESGTVNGVLAVFCSRYIVGARLENGTVTGFEAARQILALRQGSYRRVEASADDMSRISASLAVDVFRLLDWASPTSLEPPGLDLALEGVVESYARTMDASQHPIASPPLEFGNPHPQEFGNPHPQEFGHANPSMEIGIDSRPPLDYGSVSSPPLEIGITNPQLDFDNVLPPPLPGIVALDGVNALGSVSENFAETGKNYTSSDYELALGTLSNLNDAVANNSGAPLSHEIDSSERTFLPATLEGGSAFNAEELDSIQTPVSNLEDSSAFFADVESQYKTGVDEDFWAKRRTKPISDNDRQQVGEIYRDQQRSRTTREFLRVPKDRGPMEILKVRYKDPHPALTPKAITIYTCCMLLVIGSWGLQQLLTGGQNAELMRRGKARLLQGNKIEALLDFDALVRACPQDPAARLERANAYLALGEYVPAGADYEKAIALGSKEPTAFIGAARAETKSYNYQRALEHLERVLYGHPESREAKGLRAVVYSQTRKYDKAIADANAVIGSGGNAPAEVYDARAFSQWKTGNYKLALSDYDKSMEAGSPGALQLLGRGSCLTAVGRLDEAVDNLQKAIKLDPRAADAYLARARAYTARNEFQKAMADFDKAIILQHSPESYTSRGRLLVQMHEEGKAIADFDAALALEPNKPEVDQLRSAAYARVKKQKPIIAGDRAAPEEDEAPEPRKTLVKNPVKPGAVVQGSSQQSALTSVLSDAVRGNPNDVKSRRYLAYSLLQAGNSKGALEQFQLLANAGTLSGQDQMTYADLLARTGSADQAIGIYKHALQAHPGDQLARAGLIRLYQQQGRSFEAQALGSGRVEGKVSR